MKDKIYQNIADAKNQSIEASAWAEKNKSVIQPLFFKLDLNIERIYGEIAESEKVIQEGRFNRIFMVDPELGAGATAVLKVRLSDNQGREELLPLYAGAVLQADNGKVWTRVEFYNDSIDKEILVGCGMDVSYQQNLTVTSIKTLGTNEFLPLNNVSIDDSTPVLICDDLVGLKSERTDTIQNKTGGTIFLSNDSDMSTGIELENDGIAYYDSLVGLYALGDSGVSGDVRVMTQRKPL